MPKPSEFERPYVMDVTHIWRSSSRKVRLTYLFKTYVDSIKLDTTADEPVLLNRVPMVSADLRTRGFDPRTAGGDFYEYAYGAPTRLTQFFPGDYTKYGDVSPLLGSTDDEFVIFGGGDELAMKFAEPLPAQDGFNRHYIACTDGYYKDFKSAVPSFTVDPLPFASMSTFPSADGELPDGRRAPGLPAAVEHAHRVRAQHRAERDDAGGHRACGEHPGGAGGAGGGERAGARGGAREARVSPTGPLTLTS